MINSQTSTRRKVNPKKMAIIGMLSAISMMLSMVPFLGYIQIGPIAITTMCIPVIIAGIMEGPMAGMIVGFMFGATSMFRAFSNPVGINFVFMNPLVSIMPRLIIGVIAYYSFKLVMKASKNAYISGLVSGAIASFTNTAGVLTMIYVLYAQRYAEALGEHASAAKTLLIATATTNGIAEAIGGALVVSAVASVLTKSKR
ncbi:MAG: ECF transporter S component [Peptostreptococcaceae bacterium]